MDICFHAGLHKSGTTTVQRAFAVAFGKMGSVWYPLLGHDAAVNHAPLVWPLMHCLRTDPQYDTVMTGQSGGAWTLGETVMHARRSGVDKLVISCESLDMLEDSDVDAFREVCRGSLVRVVFTVTPPLHRWASLWQEMVRGGLGAGPRAAGDILHGLACLGEERLSGLVQRFPADVTTVRIVSRDGTDVDLARSVAEALALPWTRTTPSPTANESLGDDAVLLAYLNSRGATNGAMLAGSRAEFARHREAVGTRRIDDFSADDFDIPDWVATTAQCEQRFLMTARDSGTVRVLDPSGILATWESTGLPAWYERARAGSVGNGGLLQDNEAVWAQWSLARRLFYAEAALQEHERIAGDLQSQIARAQGRLERVRRELSAVRNSRAWRTLSAIDGLRPRRTRAT